MDIRLYESGTIHTYHTSRDYSRTSRLLWFKVLFPPVFQKIIDILEFLSLTPNLLECTFHDVCTTDDYGLEEILILPNLACLKFGKTTGIQDLNSDAHILRYLSLPALETLYLSFTKLTSSDFLSFLERSSPPLRKLVIGDQCNQFSFIDMEKWIHRMPLLVHLEMAAPENNLVNDLLAALAESPFDLIPHLQILRISHEPLTTLQPNYPELHQLLSSRRAKIVEFKLVAVDMFEPDPRVRDSLRQLIARGMKIFLRTKDEDFTADAT
ncbi:hypothetical protein B0H16DRAFT_1629675 [Mycena metata]|uniref:F-box domain-containing protein n=1 Tax=Mycena metata TaxID=1033252 RepID=A0AAD7H3P6_9AGAR|nr:hypothetical protein B0H16DRAFT_1629675 [Mycena metata]